MSRYRRNDRIVHVPSNQRGVVLGHKEDRLLIHWGTNDNRQVTSWHPVDEFIMDPEHTATVEEVTARELAARTGKGRVEPEP